MSSERPLGLIFWCHLMPCQYAIATAQDNTKPDDYLGPRPQPMPARLVRKGPSLRAQGVHTKSLNPSSSRYPTGCSPPWAGTGKGGGLRLASRRSDADPQQTLWSCVAGGWPQVRSELSSTLRLVRGEAWDGKRLVWNHGSLQAPPPIEWVRQTRSDQVRRPEEQFDGYGSRGTYVVFGLLCNSRQAPRMLWSVGDGDTRP
ncbi:hypothetical protein B0T26DRAFT_185047 [Lasiosphaeria miniovina]|uniref:Uncharacterized protein n=1 Tax=Lasiosphaeria miniovina TaxID=1954250 RepID=A0AA40B6V7_9PEZI|nr:uncharacterized protein B0T26DRAFT_185047 [Lasiosphaeria miniovina]KAK0728772.1 hypothetical protein B0T26DRAFT_185047 [Lasiosphaeria miniovina]